MVDAAGAIALHVAVAADRQGPAPSLPILPRRSSTLTISRTVSTPCSCCVRPRHQATITRFDAIYESRVSGCRTRPRRSPGPGRTRGSTRQSSGTRRSRGVGLDESRSSTSGSFSAASKTALATPRSSAMSPPIRTCTFMVPILVVWKVAMSTNSCGTVVRRDAASISGLMWTSCAPRRSASASQVSIRGAFVAALSPISQIASAPPNLAGRPCLCRFRAPPS